MQQTKKHLRKLCTTAELAILENSLSSKLEKLGSSELKKFIKLARKLRDKNRDLYQRQTLDSRGADKHIKVSALNARTKEKAAVFDTALKAFEARLSKVEIMVKKSKDPLQEKLPAKKDRKNNFSAEQEPEKVASNNKRKNRPSFVNGFESKEAQDAAHRHQFQQSYSTSIQGHIKSAGKRAQAKRDAR